MNQIFRHRAALYRYLRKFTSGAEDIEDLVQETYVRVYALTLSHDMDNGSIMFYARELNDKNLFIADIPLTVSGTGKNVSYSAFPGFNPLTGWYAGSGIQAAVSRWAGRSSGARKISE